MTKYRHRNGARAFENVNGYLPCKQEFVLRNCIKKFKTTKSTITYFRAILNLVTSINRIKNSLLKILFEGCNFASIVEASDTA